MELEPVTLARRQHVVGFGQTQIFRPILDGIEFGQTQIHIFIPTLLIVFIFLVTSLPLLIYPCLAFTSAEGNFHKLYDEESDHSNKAVRKTPEIESGHKVSEEVK